MRRPMPDATQPEGPPPPSPALVHAGLLAVQVGFASHYVVSKVAVRELSPATSYSVRVRAMNERGWGVWSAVLPCATLAAGAAAE